MNTTIIYAAYLVAVFAFTGWIFYLTHNPWSFVFLLLLGASVNTKGLDL